jgi:hypothetical protein
LESGPSTLALTRAAVDRVVVKRAVGRHVAYLGFFWAKPQNRLDPRSESSGKVIGCFPIDAVELTNIEVEIVWV